MSTKTQKDNFLSLSGRAFMKGNQNASTCDHAQMSLFRTHPVCLSLHLVTDTYPLILSHKKNKIGTLVSKQILMSSMSPSSKLIKPKKGITGNFDF